MSTFTATFKEIRSWPTESDWYVDPVTGLYVYVSSRIGTDYPIVAGNNFIASDYFCAEYDFRVGKNFYAGAHFKCGANFHAGHNFNVGDWFHAGADFRVGDNFHVGNCFQSYNNCNVTQCLESAYAKLVLAELGNTI